MRRQEIELLARDTSGFTDEEASSGRRIRASKVGGASAVEVVETRADVTIGGRVRASLSSSFLHLVLIINTSAASAWTVK